MNPDGVKSLLKERGIDGWLLYDFRRNNPHAIRFLGIPEGVHLTRRLFYWIPAEGEPVKVVHAVEKEAAAALVGRTLTYCSRAEMEAAVKACLQGASSIAMEYSPRGAVPTISFVDGGTLEWIKETVPSVVSSYFLLAPSICVLSEKQRRSHFEAAAVLDQTAFLTWQFLSDRMKRGIPVTEDDVRRYMLEEIGKRGCVTDAPPICAAAENSADPHYTPISGRSRSIRKGDPVLIDLWCKKKGEDCVFADISRFAVAAGAPTERQQRVFSVVRLAQKRATELIREKTARGEPVYGYEPDRAARQVIEEAGFGPYFVHRTGHNIYTEDHGPGTNLDGVETFDDRPLLPKTCFSVEPGIYLPGEFGVRLEYDLYLFENGETEITGGIQEEIERLLP